MSANHWLDVDDMDEDELYEESLALTDFDDDDDFDDEDDDEYFDLPIRGRVSHHEDEDEWN